MSHPLEGNIEKTGPNLEGHIMPLARGDLLQLFAIKPQARGQSHWTKVLIDTLVCRGAVRTILKSTRPTPRGPQRTGLRFGGRAGSPRPCPPQRLYTLFENAVNGGMMNGPHGSGTFLFWFVKNTLHRPVQDHLV